jgi:hypothetical protein
MGLLLGVSLLLLAVGAAAIARTRRRHVHGDLHRAPFVVFCRGARGSRHGQRVGWPRHPRSTARRAHGALGLSVVNLFVLPFGDRSGDLHFLGALQQRGARAVRGHGSAHTEKTSPGLDAKPGCGAGVSGGFVTGIIFLSSRRRTASCGFTPCSRRCCSSGIVCIDILLQIVPILGALVVFLVVIPRRRSSGCS